MGDFSKFVECLGINMRLRDYRACLGLLLVVSVLTFTHWQSEISLTRAVCGDTENEASEWMTLLQEEQERVHRNCQTPRQFVAMRSRESESYKWEQIEQEVLSMDADTGYLKREEGACENWVVVSTASEPRELMRQLMGSKTWCLVWVADRTPSFKSSQVVHVTEDSVKTMGFETLKHLKWDGFGRKNIGYLVAMSHGAKVIYDTDDRNFLRLGEVPMERYLRPVQKVYELGHASADASPVVNLFPLFAPKFAWPRGFPADAIASSKSEVPKVTRIATLEKVGIIQSFADEYPDVDAMYRFTTVDRFQFDKVVDLDVVRLSRGMFAPFNAQSTLFLEHALWALLLPATVTERVSDIWRGYLVQRILWDIDQHVAFCTPFVVGCNYENETLVDFNAEKDLYHKSMELVRSLNMWTPKAKTLVGRFMEGMIRLYEMSFVEEADVALARAWLMDLKRLGYEFPEIDDKDSLGMDQLLLKRAKVSAIAANKNKIIDEGTRCEVEEVKDECIPSTINATFFGFGRSLFSNSPSVLLNDDFDFGKYNYMLLDAHKAPQMDTLASLSLEFGIPKDKISTECGVNYCHRMDEYKVLFSSWEAPRNIKHYLHEKFVKQSYLHGHMFELTPELEEYLNQFDVFVCSFPTWHCQSLLHLGKVVVLRFSHTPHHSMNKLYQQKWFEDLQMKMHDNPLHVVSSNNPYHYAFYKHVTGRFPVPWPATYVHVRGEDLQHTYNPFDNVTNDTWVGEIVETTQRHTRSLTIVKELRDMLTLNTTAGWQMIDFKATVRPDDKRHKVSLAIVFPYALHTAKITELYSLGVPMILPSIESWRILCESEDKVLTHRDKQPVGIDTEYCPVGIELDFAAKREEATESLMNWLPYSEFYMWPHLYYFDALNSQSVFEMISRIMKDPADRKRRSDGMIQFFNEIGSHPGGKGVSRHEIRLKLKQALEEYDKRKEH